MVSAIKMSLEFDTDFDFHKSQQVFTTQKRRRQLLYFCMFIESGDYVGEVTLRENVLLTFLGTINCQITF